ncbi:MAG TPA: IS1595 family transposase [Candidatus Paceibacterota bacterium]
MSSAFGIRSLRKRFPSEDACLEFLFKRRYESRCSCGGTFVRIKGRRKYHCSRCLFQIAPTAGTIFEKSKVPLQLWFHALMMFSNAKSGLAAKTIQRDLEITYKCAWRMARLIRSTLKQSDEVLKGNVELDLAFFGGKGDAGKNNERLSDVFKAKTKVLAAIERKKKARAQVVSSGSARNHKNFLWQNVSTKGTKLMTDKTLHLDNAARPYDRHSVHHKKQEYVRGDVHTQTVDWFWSNTKGSIRGTHKSISPKYLQSYLDGFVFHYNNAGTDKQRFFALLDTVLQHPRA